MQISALGTGQHGTAGGPPQTAKLSRAASEFESLLITQMLKTARETSSADDDDDGAESNSSVMELGEQQFAQALANNGGLGLAKIVVAGLEHENR